LVGWRGTDADVVLTIAIIRNQTRKTLTKYKVNVKIIWKFGPISKWEKVTRRRVDIHENYDRKDTSKKQNWGVSSSVYWS